MKMKKIITFAVLVVCPVLLVLGAPGSIKGDESIIFFPTFAHKTPAGWNISFRGWIFEMETDSVRRRAALGAFRRLLGLEKNSAGARFFKERARYFLVDNQRGKKISVLLGGIARRLNESKANGHITGSLLLSEKEKSALLAGRAGGLASFRALTPEGTPRAFSGTVQFIDTTGLSVISDIDDTIKISNVLVKEELVANTFQREFKEVPGLAAVYRAWESRGAVFHYVSGSPWQLYPPIAEFVKEKGFPLGSFNFKSMRVKDKSFIEFIRAKQVEYKLGVIEPILQTFPERRFILVGDSGEKDPEIYARVAEKYRKQVIAIFIRDVKREGPQVERFRKLFEPLPKSIVWKVFQDASELNGFAPR